MTRILTLEGVLSCPRRFLEWTRSSKVRSGADSIRRSFRTSPRLSRRSSVRVTSLILKRTSTSPAKLRLGVLPLLMLALARWLPCPVELRRVILVQAAMPCAVIPVILAKHYGGDPGTALRLILATSVIGLLTIPLWLQLGLRWIAVG